MVLVIPTTVILLMVWFMRVVGRRAIFGKKRTPRYTQ